jgi:hypothetical protein
MNLVERMKTRRADFLAALAHDPDSGIRQLIDLYCRQARDAADYFFETIATATLSPEHMEAEKKSVKGIVQTVAHDEVRQLPVLTEALRRELDELAAKAIDVAFDARLAERFGKRVPRDERERWKA